MTSIKLKIEDIVSGAMFTLVGLSVGSTFINYGFILSIALFIIYIRLYRKMRIRVSSGMLLSIGIYLGYLLYGLKNPDFHIDLKYHVYWICVLIMTYTWLSNEGYNRINALISIVNATIFLVFIINSLDIVPNLWATSEIAISYSKYRVVGPTIMTFYLIPLFYSLEINKTVDRLFYLNFTLGMITCFISGSMQSLVLLAILYSLCFFELSFAKFLKLFGLCVLGIVVFIYLLFPRFNEHYQDKLKQVLNPLESSTIQTRIRDLDYMLARTTDSWQEILVGEGVGIKSVVYRKNTLSPSLSAYRQFLEIDNGYFYIYHRAGLIGCFLVLAAIVILIYNVKSNKARLIFIAFFVITNLLSIHFFTSAVAAIFVAVIANNKVDDNIHLVEEG